MKTLLLLSVLCGLLAVGPVNAVPVEATAEEEVSSVSGYVPAEEVLTEEGDSGEYVQKTVKTAEDGAPYFQSNEQPLASISRAAAARSKASCPQGWRLYKENCLMFMNLSYTWNNADAMCESLGASLASAHDLGEYSFLKQLTWRAGFLTAWMGGYRFQGFWKWEDGTPFDYNNWYQSTSYECVHLNSQESRGWTSATCTTLHPFICSIKLYPC
ncbi:unnamed protein product [Knipowitschia caucasica]|uniref:C-type lectin domain-containing protein n=1 Tax=Knipowitschia caucasica TaxID=637954 RepID=A0AAV2LMI3_KNICA